MSDSGEQIFARRGKEARKYDACFKCFVYSEHLNEGWVEKMPHERCFAPRRVDLISAYFVVCGPDNHWHRPLVFVSGYFGACIVSVGLVSHALISGSFAAEPQAAREE